ncbi:MAG: LysM peptidoglycan-binding domain-containing protein [Rubrivivax sp.]|nr:LysM peptidoglycan-binding domain-containing protein [Rubrivivax sp.]
MEPKGPTMRPVMPKAGNPLRRPLAVAALAASLIVAGCGQMPFGAKEPGAPAPRAPEPDALPAPAAPETVPTPAPAESPQPTLSPPMIQRAVASAIEHLEAGEEESAVAELGRVLQSDPGHRLARNLMRQIKEDPQALLGRESFAYRVQPGESLSRIAQRFLNDVYMFYALARYNDIKVPRLVAGGQTIRVPGKAPSPDAPAAPAQPAPAAAAKSPSAAAAPVAPPASGPAAAAAPSPTTLPSAASPPAPAPAPAPPDPARAEREREAAIARHTREARSAFAKQDLDGAIRSWDAVLALDPKNATATLERQKAVTLKQRLQRAKQ